MSPPNLTDPAPTGRVTFYDYGAGPASGIIPLGQATVGGVKARALQRIQQASTVQIAALTTAVTLRSSANPSVAGQAFSVDTTVVPAAAGGPTPTGSVRFSIDGRILSGYNLVNGMATCQRTRSRSRPGRCFRPY